MGRRGFKKRGYSNRGGNPLQPICKKVGPWRMWKQGTMGCFRGKKGSNVTKDFVWIRNRQSTVRGLGGKWPTTQTKKKGS